MKEHDYQEVKRIFQSAVELVPEEQAAFLDKECGGDVALRSEVERLIVSDDSQFMEEPAIAQVADIVIDKENELTQISPENQLDKQFGNYKILSAIGKGGMGEVYLAQDTNLNRRVALKLLPSKLTNVTQRLKRFEQEAFSVSALNHPYILTIHEFGKNQDGTHFIATEYVEGETLNEYCAIDRELDISKKLDIAIQIASALAAAHEAGIIHRDIKPENIIIRPDGYIKVLDFGISKLIEEHKPIEVDTKSATRPMIKTETGMVIGTVSYMSPEQARGKDIDHQTDIWSLGVVLYGMLSQSLPFEGETSSDVIVSILTKEPKFLRETDQEIPFELEEIVNKTLQKDKQERYQTVADLLIDLKEVKEEIEFQNKLEHSNSPNREEPNTNIFKATTADGEQQSETAESFQTNKGVLKTILAVASGILLISIVGFGFWYFFNNSKQIESIAVMPFVNESGNEDVEYLSDGMTETLIGSLSKLPNLDVKPRSSVFRYKGKDIDLRTIGKELNVQAILTGRVVQRGDQLNVSLELVEAQGNKVLWSEQYNRKQSELITLQSAIAKDVSAKIKSRLSGEDEAKVTNTGTVNPEAHQAYLRGRYYWNKRRGDDLKKAIEQFKVAADKDPNYALAYAGLGDCYALLNAYTGAPLSETLQQAKTYAERAIAIDSRLGEPHATLGAIYLRLWRWQEAEREYKQAIELSSNYATAYHRYSILLKHLGRFDEAARMIRRAHELDPMSMVIGINVSQMYQLQNKDSASIENSRKIIELYPNSPQPYWYLGLSLVKQGRYTEAIESFKKEGELENIPVTANGGLGYVYGVTGKRSEAIAIAKELEEEYARNKASGENVARVYAGLGDREKVFEWLEKDFQSRELTPGIRWLPFFESVRDDPRYRDLLKRMGLPE